ncbi:MAG: sigma-70 family RNA polymerase sigma factor [Planctomycetes bacterium]|nr:sigma-70 family RNA polymerase sigma factor [Planctomycetota bacterium]MCC6407248.1 sigma-70 family RNA polymerase sigma factor [Planctomycetota bacterium]
MADDITQSVDLVHRAQAGDREALNRLFARYYERVRRIVRVRLGPELRALLDSGDILQETFAAAVSAFDRFEMREEASLIRWLATLAERQITAAADRYGALKRDRKREVPLSPVNPASSSSPHGRDLSASGPLPIDEVAGEEEATLVDDAIRELPEEYRELILWRDYAGAEWDVVARETGRPTAAAARMMHSRAMVELTKLVRRRGLG